MEIIMPQLGETVEEGTVAAWHKKEGDKVAIDDLLVEIETDKVATELPSLAAGILRKILVLEGQTVKVGTILAIIDSGEGTRDHADWTWPRRTAITRGAQTH
jgi:pyruvate/2-oxoglutarate dehydrogenase complex dihydrolipoamide acyltransferase (E2) component